MTPEQSIKMVSWLIQRIPAGNWMKAENVKAYAEALVDLDVDAARAGAIRIVATATKFPSIAEIRSEVLSGGKPAIDPLEAWGIVSLAVRRYGRYSKPVFEDPDIAHCVEMMGWETICDSENEVADRAHFAKLFASVRDRGHRERVASPALTSGLPTLQLKAMP